MKPYKLPLREAQAEFTEKKSRFIGHIKPISTEDEAKAFLQNIREKHREASHNVYAYRLKANEIYRHNDDGEPSGTAGMPLINSFLKQDIFDFCCVATRYYGGIPLGAGGLTRAYGKCGTVALEAAGIGIMRELCTCSVALPYPLYESAKRILTAENADIKEEIFGAEVELKFTTLSESVTDLQDKITELTAGTVIIEKAGMFYAAYIH